MYVKWGGTLWATEIDHSPLDVVAWHGNYAPYKYDLRALLAGRADPVRPCRSVDLHGADLAVRDARHRQYRLRDLPRPLAGGREHFPPALVPHQRDERVHGADLRRQYDAKTGRASCRAACRCTTPCCRTVRTWTPSRSASNVELKPHKLEGTLAFMFETRFPQRVTAFAAQTKALQKDYGAYGHEAEEALQSEPAIECDDGCNSIKPMIRSSRAGCPRPMVIRTSRSRTCRSASSAPGGGGAAGRRGHRRQDPRPAAALAAASSRARPRGCRGGFRSTLNPFLALGAGPRRALAHSAVRIAGTGLPEQGSVEACLHRCGRLHAAPAGAHRRLHRLLCRHSSCHQCRQAVPSRQSAAAELQVRADRLSRPRFVDRAVRRAGAPPEGPDEAARRRQRRASAPARRLDYELELGIWIGPGNALGEPIPIG